MINKGVVRVINVLAIALMVFTTTTIASAQAQCGAATWKEQDCGWGAPCAAYTNPVPYNGSGDKSWIVGPMACMCFNPNLLLQNDNCLSGSYVRDFQQQYARREHGVGVIDRRPVTLATCSGDTVVLGM